MDNVSNAIADLYKAIDVVLEDTSSANAGQKQTLRTLMEVIKVMYGPLY
jgi:hypothetical protein